MALTDGLIEVWKLDEASGNALGAVGGITLTETSGTIGAASGLVYPTARVFAAPATESFSVADSAPLSFADDDFTFAVWFKAASTAAPGHIFAKDDAIGGPREYAFRQQAGEIQWFIWSPNNVLHQLNSSVPVSVGNWQLGIVDHNKTTNLMSVQIDNGAIETLAITTGCTDGPSPFQVGSRNEAPEYWDGQIGPLIVWDRPLTTDERTAIYNGGDGLVYPFPAGGRIVRSDSLMGLGLSI